MRPLVPFLLMLLFSVAAKAQDPHFSQYLSVPTYLNPAFAGYDGCSRFIASYRNQWPGFVSGGNYQTVQASYDQYVRPMRGGIGVNLQYDLSGEGTVRSHSASVVYSPVFRLLNGKLVVSPAVEAGWRNRNVEWTRLPFGPMTDPRYGIIYETHEATLSDRIHVFDASAGILFSHHNLVYGVAFHNIAQPDVGLIGPMKLPLRSTTHATYHGQVTPRFSVSPSFIYMNQQGFHMFLHALAFEFYGARLGAGFRHHVSSYDAVILMAGYSHRRFSIGYSFDFTVSSLGMKTGGSHEINLALRFNCRNKEEWRKGPRLMGF